MRLGQERRPVGQIVVPLDQRWQGAGQADRPGVKLPDRIGHRPVVAVDQQGPPGLVRFAGMAGKVDFLNAVKRMARDMAMGIPPLVRAGHHDSVDVRQEPAARPPRQFGDEIDRVPAGFGKASIGRGVFQKHLAGQRLGGIGQRQKVVQKAGVVAGPGQMFGKHPRLTAVDQHPQPGQVVRVQRPRAADRQAYAMPRRRVVLPDQGQPAVRRATRAHVILGMDFKEAKVGRGCQDRRQMGGLQADAAARWQGGMGHRGLRQKRAAKGAALRPPRWGASPSACRGPSAS